jgi:hypothetical protein
MRLEGATDTNLPADVCTETYTTTMLAGEQKVTLNHKILVHNHSMEAVVFFECFTPFCPLSKTLLGCDFRYRYIMSKKTIEHFCPECENYYPVLDNFRICDAHVIMSVVAAANNEVLIDAYEAHKKTCRENSFSHKNQ